jgi:copper oxidase (laccase) domain-containing protein
MEVEKCIQYFPALDASGVCRAIFITRIPDIDVADEKSEVLRRLDSSHLAVREKTGIGGWPLVTAQQVHGNRIAVIDGAISGDAHHEGVDGLVTNQRKVALGIYVADCGAVYLVDPKTPAIGLVHSGKRGTEAAIAAGAIEQMTKSFGTDPRDLIVQLSPCIRPPHYEVDFAAQILEQCRAAGVNQIHDCGICTACDLDTYYSYRMEKGKTGRMLALLGLL